MQHDYGYRLFVDDLPSATVSKGKTHYEWTVPLGFVPEEAPPQAQAQRNERPYKPVAVYNHLDIKIKVHPTFKSNVVGSATPKKIDVGFMGNSISIDLPE